MIGTILVLLFLGFVIFSFVSIQNKLDRIMLHLGINLVEIQLTDSQIEEMLNEEMLNDEKTNEVLNEVFDESRTNKSNK